MPTILNLQKKYQNINNLEFTLLLSHTLKKNRGFIFAHPEYKFSLTEQLRFYYYLKKYKRGVPTAYIIGQKEFFGLNFFVNKHTLIPRPDTELMVEEVIAHITNEIVLIDVGTGTGCIPIAIAKNAPKQIHIVAIDQSHQALKIAQKNATQHNVPITFLHGNLLEPVLAYFPSKSSVIITANLPYLTHEQFEQEPSIQHEPYQALVASDGGLGLYKIMFGQIKILATKLTIKYVYIEIDPYQTDRIVRYLQNLFTQPHIEIKKDLAGRDRLVVLYINS